MGITPQQFKRLEERLARPARSVAPVLESALRAPTRAHQVILGIDPSLRGTGYGVIRCGRPHPVALTYGTITCPPAWEHSRCLVRIVQVLREVLKQHQPTVCAVEGIFFAQNLKTAIVMGEARGAALSAVAESGVQIYEIAPRKVKQAVAGYGAANKPAVARMVQRLLQLPQAPAFDAADALALALAHAQENGRYSLTAPRKV